MSAKQGNGRRTVTWNIGVSPMRINVPIMVNQELVQDEFSSAYTTRLEESYTISSQFFENKAERE